MCIGCITCCFLSLEEGAVVEEITPEGRCVSTDSGHAVLSVGRSGSRGAGHSGTGGRRSGGVTTRDCPWRTAGLSTLRRHLPEVAVSLLVQSSVCDGFSYGPVTQCPSGSPPPASVASASSPEPCPRPAFHLFPQPDSFHPLLSLRLPSSHTQRTPVFSVRPAQTHFLRLPTLMDYLVLHELQTSQTRHVQNT